MKYFKVTAILLTILTKCAHGDVCSMENIRNNTNRCLHDNLVVPGTEFLLPVFRNSSDLLNFCKRTKNDIKVCIMNHISACTSDKVVQVMFGSSGSALTAAYDGICAEPDRDSHLTCAYNNYSTHISQAVQDLVAAADAITMPSHSETCQPMHNLHNHILIIYDEAIASDDCTEKNKIAIHEFLSTLSFPCKDVATKYYPCTLQRLNADAIEQCYLRNGVSVENAVIPTPGSLTHADEFCRTKDMIQVCFKNLINKCLYEPQVTTLFGATATQFEAGFNCMCNHDNSDMILSCATSADVTTAMQLFTESVHNHSAAGTLDKSTQCALEMTMKNKMKKELSEACTTMKEFWVTYVDTVFYPCTTLATKCYPKNMYGGNGAESPKSLRKMFSVLFMHLLALLVI